MAFSRGPIRGPKPPRVHATVFAVGRRVYVTCAGDRSARAMLTDDTGKRPLGALADGSEMTILGWRPGWSGTALYRVRATESGLEGWLPVGNLRATEIPAPATAAAAPPPAVTPAPLRGAQREESTRRFGERHT
jgi:hypothetical protein